jgi:two-component system response regulator PilR (NtrC family)
MAAYTTPSLLSLPEDGCKLDDVLSELERRLLVESLERTGGLRKAAADLLGISFRSIRYRLAKHGLDAGVDGALEGEDSGEASAPSRAENSR